jgi:tetratricopeptide (TPR) repeat protein
VEACPDDTELAAFVEHALTPPQHEAVERHVHACTTCREALGHAVAIGERREDWEPAPGETIDRFVLRSVLGIGGMGVVYAARDPELHRDVAIKLLHAGTPDARQRLLREAQALAKIDHPNVIKVYDVGDHEDQVYIAMELATAGSLRAWLAQPRTTREVIDAFVAAGRGLAAAHAAGLVHRDFKPDNVLLFAAGRICVTDFGLAGTEPGAFERAATAPIEAGDATGHTTALTRTGAVMGTPHYMSPEQFRGEPASAASDQFSFCVALYEAIYGGHPFGGTTFAELAMAVTEGELREPPRRGPGWLRRTLERGLARDPAHRFASMTALVGELARDRKARWIRTGAVLGALAVTGGIVLAVRGAPAVSCDSGADRVARVWNPVRRAQLAGAFSAASRPRALETYARIAPLVDDWTAAWMIGHRDACEATRVRGEQSAGALDLRTNCLDQRLAEVGAFVDALATGDGVTIDHALDAALRLPSIAPCSHATGDVALPASANQAAQVTALRTALARSGAELELGHFAAARARADALRGIARTIGYAPAIADVARAAGEAELRLADRAAIDDLRAAVHTARTARDTPSELAASAGLVEALTRLAGKYELALELSNLADASAAAAPPAIELAVHLDDARGDLELARGMPQLARTRFEHALARAEPVLGRDHIAVIDTLERLGNVLKVQGKFAEARALYERVLATRQRLEAPDHPDVANAIDNLGNVARAESKLDAAQQLFERALAIRIAALGQDHPAVADSYNNLGALAADRGDPSGARRYFERARAVYEHVYGADSVELAGALTNLGNSLVVVHDFPAAIAVLERSRSLFEAKLGPNDEHVAYAVSELGVVAERQGRLDDALALIRQAEKVEIAAQGPDHPDVADYLEREASVLTSQGKLAETEPILTRAIAIYRGAYGSEHPRVAIGLGALAQLQGRRDDYKGALATWQDALAIFEHTLPADHPNLTFALAGIGDALTELGRPTEALPYLDRALAIRTSRHMPPEQVAEIHFYFAAALVAASATRARAIQEARTALALYKEAGDADDVHELTIWLAKHA